MDFGPFEFIFPVSNETDLQVLETKLRRDFYFKNTLVCFIFYLLIYNKIIIIIVIKIKDKNLI